MLLLPIAGFARRDNMSEAINRIMKEAKACAHKDGFEVMTIGSTGMGLTRSLASLASRLDEDDDEDLAQSLAVLEGIEKLVIVDYEDARPRDKARFSETIEEILSGQEVLMESKDEGEITRIYGSSSENGEKIRNFVLFCPQEGSLICILGEISLADMATIMDN